MKKRKKPGTKVIDAKHKQVVDTYLADPRRNQAQAYMSVYNCTPESAWSAATRLFKDVRVAEYLEMREKEIADAAKVKQVEVLEGLKIIAQTGLQKLKARTRATKNEDGETILEPQDYVRLVDGSNAAKALELLGKTEKMFTDRIEQETTHRFVFSVNK